MTEERLTQWFNGHIDDEDLTNAEVLELEKLVHEAVAAKILARPGVHCFPVHKTLQ